MSIVGEYLDGKTSKRMQARLEFSRTDKRVVNIVFKNDGAPDGLVIVAFEALKIESRLGDTPREISFGQGELFVTLDNDSVDEFIKSRAQKKHPWSSLLYRLESNLSLVVVATTVTIFVSWAMVVYGVPKMAEVIAYQLPVSLTQKSGDGLGVLDKTLFEATALTQDRQDEVQAFLAPYLHTHGALEAKLNFRSGMGANAFALPDGNIVFTDDFVNLSQNNEELLAVLFHELGHLKYRHISRRALQGSMIAVLFVFITGDVNSIELFSGLPSLVLDLSYSRDFETEADSYALEQMNASKIDLDHFARIMQRLASYSEKSDESCTEACDNPDIDKPDIVSTPSEHKFNDYLSTHPSTKDRVSLVARYKRQAAK